MQIQCDCVLALDWPSVRWERGGVTYIARPVSTWSARSVLTHESASTAPRWLGRRADACWSLIYHQGAAAQSLAGPLAFPCRRMLPWVVRLYQGEC